MIGVTALRLDRIFHITPCRAEVGVAGAIQVFTMNGEEMIKVSQLSLKKFSYFSIADAL